MERKQKCFDVFKRRREKLISQLKSNEAIILVANPVYYRQHDVFYPYRQDSFFYYLTGFEEPNACLVLRKNQPSSILFVRDKDPKKEMWEGVFLGPSKAKELLLMSACFGMSEFENQITKLLKGVSYIYQARTINKLFDQQLDRILIAKKTQDRNSPVQFHFLDVKERISEMRMIKDQNEIQNIEQACAITGSAHIEVMKAVQPGVNERQLHGIFIQSIMSHYAQRESYTGIFAAGENALILHYIDNNQLCHDGDLVLVDAGAEWEYYASDITRTFPVNGRFNKHQKILYNHVLNIQKSIINMIRRVCLLEEFKIIPVN